MKLGPVKNWQDFVTTIMPFMAMSSAGLHRFGQKYPPYLFRGLTHSSYKLTATIFRSFEKNGEVKMDESFFKKERNVNGMVRNKLADYLKCSEWDLVAVAQHYGIPTRYLDWTSNPFVALAFAFKHDWLKAKEEHPVVWVLKTNCDDFCIPEGEESPSPDYVGAKTKIYLPKKIVGQVIAQDSYLMRQVVEKESEGVFTVNSLEMNPTFRDRLWKIEFENESVCDIVEGLHEYGISEKDLLNPENWEGLKIACKDMLNK